MKVLITGANGFVGLHLLELLLKSNHEVFALVRNPKTLNHLSHPKLHILQGSIDEINFDWIKSLPHDLETCVHTAGIVHSFILDEFLRINAFATENLIENLLGINPNIHFVLISSLAAAGPSLLETPRSEEEMLFPVSNYGRSKKKAEEILRNSKIKHQTIIRPPMVIGPRDGAVLDIFKMVKSRIIVMPGLDSKAKQYSFVCVFDLIETIKRVVENKKTGVFFSASPEVITFKELIEKIKKLFGYHFIIYLPLPKFITKLVAFFLNLAYRLKPHNIRLTPDKYFELTAKNFTCSGKKSEQELSQFYQYDINKTLEVTFADYKSKNWI